ncbi:MAG: heavy-metal-associated domain-containing protein [Pseudomonadota bacterium]
MDFHAVVAKSGAMLRRSFLLPLLLILALAGISVAVYAQLESGNRGILPIDSSGLLEVGGIHVDVEAKDSVAARYAGWRIAQREGFRKLYAEMHRVPLSKAPSLPDSTLDQIVSSISVEREEIGPSRYIADLGIMFDRARAAEYLGVAGGEVQRSVPMLLIPVTITGGTATSVELRNAWQRAWAQYRTSDSAIDYVRISGLGVDPILVNAAQLTRPGRGWWRNIVDLYGAADILVAEVQLERLYPGGLARARFIARHGPDNQIVGGFTLTAKDSDSVPAMMALGVKRMDELFTTALAAGQLQRDSSLNLPPPPVEVLPEVEAPKAAAKATNAFQVQVSGRDVSAYNFAMAHLRTLPGVESASPQQINAGGTSYVLVSFAGDLNALANALRARGWVVEASGSVVRIKPSSDKPPPIPPPPQAAPPPTQPAKSVAPPPATAQPQPGQPG